MKYFRNAEGAVVAFESDGSQDEFISDELLAMTAEEISLHLNPPVDVENLCSKIDSAADGARRAVAGDPLRAVEYDRARIEAQAFADAGYPADAVPRTVAAWAINGRTPAEAAESILAEAAAYTNALYSLREIRLRAKADILIRMAAGETEEAQSIAHEATAAIEAAVAGIGNA